MTNPVIYVFANKGLHMSAGKLASQVGHAVATSMIASNEHETDYWSGAIHKTIIVLDAKDSSHMERIHEYMSQRDFEMCKVIDEGGDEIEGYELTATSSLILDKDSDHVKQAFGWFKTYRDIVKITTQFER